MEWCNRFVHLEDPVGLHRRWHQLMLCTWYEFCVITSVNSDKRCRQFSCFLLTSAVSGWQAQTPSHLQATPLRKNIVCVFISLPRNPFSVRTMLGSFLGILYFKFRPCNWMLKIILEEAAAANFRGNSLKPEVICLQDLKTKMSGFFS